MSPEAAIPILPSRDLSRTTAFYGRLGFVAEFRQDEPDPYLIVRRGAFELHFFLLPDLDPYTSNHMCYLRVADVDALHAEWQPLGLPTAGIPRVTAPRDGDHGMRELAVVDPDGTLVRVGQVIDG